MSNDRQRAIRQARALVQLDPVIIDTETTGMDDDDQVVELAAVDLQGRALTDTLVKATVPVRPEARDVHGIGDADLLEAPALSVTLKELRRKIGDRPLAAYNAPFDQRMLLGSLRAQGEAGAHQDLLEGVHCIMRLYARYRGHWNSYHRSYRFHALMTALAHEKRTVEGEAHRALTDAQAAAQLLLAMAESDG